jgi:hypothetical protein
VCLAALSGVANAVKLKLEQAPDKPGVFYIHINGPIKEGEGENFRNWFGANGIGYNKALVYLNSPGGNAIAGFTIGMAIRRWAFSTFIAPNTRCASACADIWLAGNPRFVGPGAAVGFHQSTTLEGDVMSVQYYQALGLPDRTIRYLLRAAPDDMQWLTPADATEDGITYKCWRC